MGVLLKETMFSKYGPSCLGILLKDRMFKKYGSLNCQEEPKGTPRASSQYLSLTELNQRLRLHVPKQVPLRVPLRFGFFGSRLRVAQIVHTLTPTYLYREYLKAKVYTTFWVHGPSGND